MILKTDLILRRFLKRNILRDRIADVKTIIQKRDLLAVGTYAICSQAIFIREMLGLFSGTEFVVSLLISSWLLWVGVGGIKGGRLFKGIFAKRFSAFRGLIVFAALIFPATILFIRYGRGLLVTSPGEMPPFFKSILFCVFAIFPVAFANGLIYNAASKWWGEKTGVISTGVSWVYILEAAGSVVGGLLFSFVLLEFFTQFEISLIISFIMITVILRPFRIRGRFWCRIIFIIILGSGMIFLSNKLDYKSISWLFPEFTLRGFSSSRYGEIAAVQKGGAVSYFSGGSRYFTIPDIQNIEEVVHIPLLSHKNPGRVLIIGGGLAGEIKEIFKHNSVESVDCVQLDDRLMKMVREISKKDNLDKDDFTEDDRVNYFVGDGRLFLKETNNKYDIIIVNTPDPLNLELNRYYTKEFFNTAKSALLPEGIFTISHSSSENFISDALSMVLRTIRKSLDDVFGGVSVIPGTVVHFIGSEREITASEILNNLKKRRLDTQFINMNYIPYRFSEDRLNLISSRTHDLSDVDVNSDLIPILTAYEMFLEFKKKGLNQAARVGKITAVSKWFPVVAGAVIIILIFLIPGEEVAAKLDVWGVGLTSFLFQINLLLAYQSFSGYLYNGIVFLTAFFMAGISIGTWSTYKIPFKFSRDPQGIHAAFIIFSFFYVIWLLVIGRVAIGIITGSIAFIAASFIGGFLTGIFYRVVVSSTLDRLTNQQPAVFYAWDMFGACVGGILGGIFIYPFSGSPGAIALFVFIHISSMLLLTRKWKKTYLSDI